MQPVVCHSCFQLILFHHLSTCQTRQPLLNFRRSQAVTRVRQPFLAFGELALSFVPASEITIVMDDDGGMNLAIEKLWNDGCLLSASSRK